MNHNGFRPNGDLHSDVCSTGMEATGYKLFNDSVHGHITLHPLLVRIVDTPQFQRLRNIKQLGAANYVFPGASHCRYEHSLGTCYLAGLMVDKLLEREENNIRSVEEIKKLALCVQLAALCHDLGHGPFSHTWEQVTQQWGESWKHEEASVKLFDYVVESNHLTGVFSKHGLEDDERKIIKQLIMGGPSTRDEKPQLGPQDNFLYEIVSNKETGIDVDKWDYFLRDGLHLNLSITFDYRRLLEFCTVVTSKDGRTHIAFRDKEIMNLYDMFRVRSALHHTAYRHRVVLNIELMFIDAFVAAGEAGYKINNSEVLLKDAHKTPESMSEITDHIFYDILYSSDPSLGKAQNCLKRVWQRKLYMFVEKANIHVEKPVEKANIHVKKVKIHVGKACVHVQKGDIHVDQTQMAKEKRQNYIKEKKAELMQSLAENFPSFEFGIGEFFLDLDCHNDPISKVKFYTKQRGSNTIQVQKYQEIKDLLDPFPFQLTREPTAVLSVFCKTEGATEQDLADAKKLIKDFSNDA